jgi:hypothetical protein
MTPELLHASTLRSGDILPVGAPSVEHAAVEHALAPATPRLLLRPHETVVGECLDVGNPSLVGRVLVRWSLYIGPGGSAWLPTLHGVPVRAGDRVLVTQPSNVPEPVVVGVIDGIASRSESQRAMAHGKSSTSTVAMRMKRCACPSSACGTRSSVTGVTANHKYAPQGPMTPSCPQRVHPFPRRPRPVLPRSERAAPVMTGTVSWPAKGRTMTVKKAVLRQRAPRRRTTAPLPCARADGSIARMQAMSIVVHTDGRVSAAAGARHSPRHPPGLARLACALRQRNVERPIRARALSSAVLSMPSCRSNARRSAGPSGESWSS